MRIPFRPTGVVRLRIPSRLPGCGMLVLSCPTLFSMLFCPCQTGVCGMRIRSRSAWVWYACSLLPCRVWYAFSHSADWYVGFCLPAIWQTRLLYYRIHTPYVILQIYSRPVNIYLHLRFVQPCYLTDLLVGVPFVIAQQHHRSLF